MKNKKQPKFIQKKICFLAIVVTTQTACRQDLSPTGFKKKCFAKTLGASSTHSPLDGLNKIVGGVKMTDTTDPRVAATVKLDIGKSWCTAILIGPNLIASAAHCMDSTAVTIYFDADLKDAKKGPTKKAKKLKKHPKFTEKTFPEFDMAFVTFDGPPPAPYKPLPVYGDVAKIKEKDPITLAGYGILKTKGNEPGHLRMVDTIFWKYLLPSSKTPGEGLLLYGPNKGKGSCNGDSGGPSFIKGADGQWYVLGVDNGPDLKYFPQVSKKEFDTDDCNTGAEIYTAIIYYKDWIEKESGEKILLSHPASQPPKEAIPPTPLPDETPPTSSETNGSTPAPTAPVGSEADGC